MLDSFNKTQWNTHSDLNHLRLLLRLPVQPTKMVGVTNTSMAGFMNLLHLGVCGWNFFLIMSHQSTGCVSKLICICERNMRNWSFFDQCYYLMVCDFSHATAQNPAPDTKHLRRSLVFFLHTGSRSCASHYSYPWIAPIFSLAPCYLPTPPPPVLIRLSSPLLSSPG